MRLLDSGAILGRAVARSVQGGSIFEDNVGSIETEDLSFKDHFGASSNICTIKAGVRQIFPMC